MGVSIREQCSKCHRTYSRPEGTKNICERCKTQETCRYCGGNQIIRSDWHNIEKCPRCKGKGTVPIGSKNEPPVRCFIG